MQIKNSKLIIDEANNKTKTQHKFYKRHFR